LQRDIDAISHQSSGKVLGALPDTSPAIRRCGAAIVSQKSLSNLFRRDQDDETIQLFRETIFMTQRRRHETAGDY
jgi:hypothetical protein